MSKGTPMYYLSALLAIVGAVGYQYLVKRIPHEINPLISVLGTYLAIIVLCVAFLPLFPAEGGVMAHVRQLSWIQIALAASVFLIEIGFLLMYRFGWNLSTGNLITGVVINIALLGLGVLLLGEKMSAINLVGVVLSIVGVALIGYRP